MPVNEPGAGLPPLSPTVTPSDLQWQIWCKERERQLLEALTETREQARLLDMSATRELHLRQALAAMTEDRDLWRDQHGDDCPYKERADSLEQALADARRAALEEAADTMLRQRDCMTRDQRTIANLCVAVTRALIAPAPGSQDADKVVAHG